MKIERKDMQVMDILLEVLNEHAIVPQRRLPLLNPKTNAEVIRKAADDWASENCFRDVEGELDWAGLIQAELSGALGSTDKKARRRRLLATAALVVAAIKCSDNNAGQ